MAHRHMFLALFHHRKPKTPASTPRSHHNSLSSSALVDETLRQLDTCPTESLRNLSPSPFSSAFIIYHLVISQSMLAPQSLPIRSLFAAVALPQSCSALSHGSSSLAAFLRVGIPCLCNKVGAPSVRIVSDLVYERFERRLYFFEHLYGVPTIRQLKLTAPDKTGPTQHRHPSTASVRFSSRSEFELPYFIIGLRGMIETFGEKAGGKPTTTGRLCPKCRMERPGVMQVSVLRGNYFVVWLISSRLSFVAIYVNFALARVRVNPASHGTKTLLN